MAAPNMLALNSITGSIGLINLTTNAATQLLSNAAASSTVLKVNAVYVSNIDGTTAYPISLNVYSAAALGGTAYSLASTISVPANSTLVLVDKDANLYLSENTSLGATAGTGNKFNVVVTYELCS
jgi:hypothetical protein